MIQSQGHCPTDYLWAIYILFQEYQKIATSLYQSRSVSRQIPPEISPYYTRVCDSPILFILYINDLIDVLKNSKELSLLMTLS